MGHLRVKHQSCVGSAWALLLHHRCVPQRLALSCPHLDQAHSSPTQAHLPALPCTSVSNLDLSEVPDILCIIHSTCDPTIIPPGGEGYPIRAGDAKTVSTPSCS